MGRVTSTVSMVCWEQLTLLVALPLAVGAAVNNKIPSYIQICKRNDPHLENCILNSIENLRPKLISGIPELDVPPIEPLIIPEFVVSTGGRFRALGRNVTIHGAGNFKVAKLNVDVDKLIFKVGVELPALYFNADYDVDARILLLTLKGRGPLLANASDIYADVELQAQLVKKKSNQYLRFYNIKVDVRIRGDTTIHLDNLFNGEKTLNDATNAALNENSREFLSAIKPVAEKAIAEFLIDSANKITLNFTWDELFPKE